MKRIIIGLFAILYSANLYSQDIVSEASRIHTITFNTQYIQIKDEFNYGLVFSGPNLVAGYSFAKITDKDILGIHLRLVLAESLIREPDLPGGLNRLTFFMVEV